MRYVGGIDEQGHEIDVRDPLADRLRIVSAGAETPQDTVSALLSVEEIFGSDVDPRFRLGLQSAFQRLSAVGSKASAKEIA